MFIMLFDVRRTLKRSTSLRGAAHQGASIKQSDKLKFESLTGVYSVVGFGVY